MSAPGKPPITNRHARWLAIICIAAVITAFFLDGFGWFSVNATLAVALLGTGTANIGWVQWRNNVETKAGSSP